MNDAEMIEYALRPDAMREGASRLWEATEQRIAAEHALERAQNIEQSARDWLARLIGKQMWAHQAPLAEYMRRADDPTLVAVLGLIGVRDDQIADVIAHLRGQPTSSEVGREPSPAGQQWPV